MNISAKGVMFLYTLLFISVYVRNKDLQWEKKSTEIKKHYLRVFLSYQEVVEGVIHILSKAYFETD